MAKKIFSLVGASSCGKTNTLKALIAKFPNFKPLTPPISNYRRVDVVGTCRYNGKLIGISTDSDLLASQSALKELIRRKCHIIFCASHPQRGGLTYKYVESKAAQKDYYCYGIRQPWIQSGVAARNATRAASLKDLI